MKKSNLIKKIQKLESKNKDVTVHLRGACVVGSFVGKIYSIDRDSFRFITSNGLISNGVVVFAASTVVGVRVGDCEIEIIT